MIRYDGFKCPPPLTVDMSESDSDDMYCAKHNLDSPAYEDTADPHCPYCREESRLEAERRHMMTRDTRVEPW